jgi:hypothetical protein
MKYIPVSEAIDTEKLRHFIALARQYRLLMEEQQPVSPAVFLPQVQLLLADIYSAALKLDWIDLQSDVDYELDAVDLEKILWVVAEKIGDYRYYWSVFDPADMQNTAPGCGTYWMT